MYAAFNPYEELAMTQHAKWYRLGGNSLKAVLRAIELSEQPDPDIIEVKKTLRDLGHKFAVGRTDALIGWAAVYPSVFATSKDDEFYMLCPIGTTAQDAATHFMPAGGTELDEEQAAELTNRLFPPQGAAVPFISKETKSIPRTTFPDWEPGL